MNLDARRCFAAIVLLALPALAGCSTTNRLVSQWSNPGYAASPVHKILVGGSGGESAIRRNLEDEFVAQLRAAGIDAEPSYRYIPDDQNVDAANLQKTAKQTAADAVILARSSGVERKTEYRPSYYPYTSFGVFGPHVGASWYGLYGEPSVRQYDVYTSETTLYDSKNDVVWTGTVRTIDPDNVNAAIKDYVEIVLKALEEKKLLRGNR
jgi:hypothetical protein